MKEETVCAVVVTYNRKNLLIECLEGILNQTRPVDGIYIIDNDSNDGTPQLLFDKGFIKQLPPDNLSEPWEQNFVIQNKLNGEKVQLYYVRMHKNTGGAGGFYEGVKRAYEKGYDWIWLMDDDAEPLEDTLKKLLEINADVTVPLIVGKDSRIQNYHHKIISKVFLIEKPAFPFTSIKDIEKIENGIQLDANAFVGPLIKRSVVEKCGFPNPNLFIWGDDVDYTYRINKSGYKIIMSKEAKILHKDFSSQKQKNQVEYWKVYYGIRNRTLFMKDYGNFLSLSYLFTRIVLSYLANRDYRLLKTKLNAFKDGLKLKSF